MMSIIKRNVKKYAGAGLAKFNALPVILSKEDAEGYTALVASLCKTCQVSDIHVEVVWV